MCLQSCSPRFDPRFPYVAFSRLSHTSGLKIGTPVASLSGSWLFRVSVGTGWPSDQCQ